MSDVNAALHAAKALAAQGDEAAARAAFQEVLAAHGRSVETLNAYACFEYSVGRYAAAVEGFKAAMAVDPDHAVVAHNALQAARRLGDARVHADLLFRQRRVALKSILRQAVEDAVADPIPYHPQGRHLILTQAMGLSVKDVAPFFRSLERAGVAADVHVFATNLDRATLDWIRGRGAVVEPCDDANYMTMNTYMTRFIKFADFLSGFRANRRVEGLGGVFLTDIRDVVFQSDPFAGLAGDALLCFLEADHVRLGAEGSNRHWALGLFGPGFVDRFHDRRISCCGTVLGGFGRVHEYLLRMQIEFLGLDSTSDLLIATPPDQVIHNKLLYTGAMAGMEERENGDVVLTMGVMPRDGFAFDGGVVTTARGTPAVLHQYDRHPDLRRDILAGLGLETA